MIITKVCYLHVLTNFSTKRLWPSKIYLCPYYFHFSLTKKKQQLANPIPEQFNAIKYSEGMGYNMYKIIAGIPGIMFYPLTKKVSNFSPYLDM